MGLFYISPGIVSMKFKKDTILSSVVAEDFYFINRFRYRQYNSNKGGLFICIQLRNKTQRSVIVNAKNPALN
jgi:hypothetical protein